MDSAVPSAFIATLPPFQFHSGSTENFDVKGPDVGELIQLIIQVKNLSCSQSVCVVLTCQMSDLNRKFKALRPGEIIVKIIFLENKLLSLTSFLSHVLALVR